MQVSSYRHELDGVRALCIISVVLFHVGFPSLSGGFIGVDVFFVISGYLICGQIYLSLLDGRFSIGDFFARRIRRLAAAYGLCFLTVAFLADQFYLRSEMTLVAKNFLGSILFFNNFQLMTADGYFAAPNELNPFLHTWTLSIEEQFYIVIPLIALLFQRDPKRFVWMLSFVFALSLALSLFSGDLLLSKEERYFSSSFRVWQIASGGLAFLALHHLGDRFAFPGAALLGVALILAPVFVIDGSYLYPHWVTVVPVAGAILIILSGTPERSPTARVLASRPLAYLGRISYGTYLWHWPLIVGVIYYGIRPTDEIRSIIVIAAFALGAMSYHFVEMPVRVLSISKHRGRIFGFFAVQLVVSLGVAAYLFHQAGKGDDTENARLAELSAQIDKTHDGWDACWGHSDVDQMCKLGVDQPGLDYMLYGDSMANSAFFALDDYGKGQGASGLLATKPSCAPLLGVARSEDCIAFNDAIVAFLDQAEPMDVFIMGWWSYYAEGLRNFGTLRGDVPLIYADGRQADDTFPAFEEGLDAMLARISQRHRVILINTIPKFETSVPKAMLRAFRFGTELPVLTRAEFDAVQGRATQTVADLAEKHGVLLVEPHKVFCDDALCQMDQDGVPLYMDQVHLGVRGNELLLDMILDRLEAER